MGVLEAAHSKRRIMNFIALKMLVGDRAKYIGIIIGLTFASVLITQLASGCKSLPSGPPVYLPEGDAERGQVPFHQLQLCVCHAVSGHSRTFPGPSAQPPTLVVLGAEDPAPTCRELVDSIINPSHKLYAGPAPELEKSGKLSRMGDFSDA